MTDTPIKKESDQAPSMDLLKLAHQRAQAKADRFAGHVYPSEAWSLWRGGAAVLIDVRTVEERKFVGRVPQTPHVPWKLWPGMAQNENFVEEVEDIAPKDTVVMLLCRSGVRSVAAAEALTQAGYSNVLNVLEGFEGELDNQHHRGTFNGWRHAGLPWVQD